MMRDIDRRRLLKGIGATSVAGLAGCTGGGSGDNGTDSTATGGDGQQQTVEITYRDRKGASNPSVYADVFNESHDSIQVNPSMKPVEEKYRSLIAQISAGNAPDVMGLDVIYLPRFTQLGALKNLDSFYEGLDYTDDIFKPLRQDFIRWDGGIYGMPFWIDVSGYYYNMKHYEEAGLDPESPPETFSEFLNACDALQQAGYDTPLSNTLGFVGLELFFFMPHVWAGGGALFNEDRTKSLIDQQPAVDALEFFLQLQENDYVTDQTSTENFTYSAFVSEDTSMAYGGGDGVGIAKEQNPEMFENMGFAMFPHPEGGKSSSFLGGNSITISAQTSGEKLKASKEFVKWVNTDEGARVTVEELGFLPARKSAFETDFVQNRQRIFGGFQRALEQGHAPPMHPQLLEMQEPLNNAIERALLGDQEPQAALSQAASEINAVLKSN